MQEHLSTHQYEPRKLCSRNHRRTDRTTVWLTPKALRQLEWLLEFYYRVLGERPVSTSLVVRRSLGVLQEHIQEMLRKGNLEAVLAEGEHIKGMR